MRLKQQREVEEYRRQAQALGIELDAS
jgi:hypothetical protein